MKAVPISPTGNKASVVKYGNEAHVQFYCNKHQTTASFVNAVNKITRLPNQLTNTEAGIKMGYDVLKTNGCGRKPQTMILVTDGESNRGGNLSSLIAEAKRIQNDGIVLLAVAIGEFKLDQLRNMTNHIFQTYDYDNLKAILRNIVASLCLTTTSTPATTITTDPDTTTPTDPDTTTPTDSDKTSTADPDTSTTADPDTTTTADPDVTTTADPDTTTTAGPDMTTTADPDTTTTADPDMTTTADPDMTTTADPDTTTTADPDATTTAGPDTTSTTDPNTTPTNPDTTTTADPDTTTTADPDTTTTADPDTTTTSDPDTTTFTTTSTTRNPSGGGPDPGNNIFVSLF